MYNLLTANSSFQIDGDLISIICVCVILPVSITALVMWVARNNANRKAEIMTKAIEAGVSIPEDFWEQMNDHKKKDSKIESKTIKGKLLKTLKKGITLSGLGLVFTVICMTGALDIFDNDIFSFAGVIMLVLGIGNIVYYFVASRSMADRIKAEEEIEVAEILKKKAAETNVAE